MKRKLFFNFLRNWYNLKKFFRAAQTDLLYFLNAAIPLILFFCVCLVIYDFGFKLFWSNSLRLNFWLRILLNILIVLMGVRLLLDIFRKKKLKARIFTLSAYIFVLILALYIMPVKASMANYDTNRFLVFKIILYAGIVLTFITEASYLLQFIYSKTINPALLFVASFAFLILLGALLLKLPNATSSYISIEDALFTSASAVCVTGMFVLDTTTKFTGIGHLIILMLIQVGALGIMTFASLLAYAVAGGASFKSQLIFKDMFSGRKMGNMMHFVSQVVIVTLSFELVGALLIYFTVGDDLFTRQIDKIFFSVFHGISAFCNAGISTLPSGLYNPELRFNYSLHLIIAVLIILGGMGFPILFNLFNYSRVKFSNFLRSFNNNPKRLYIPRLININSRLALVVSGILLLLGFIAFFVFEQDHTLKEHPTLTGKLITSFFGSVAPRTAGFTTVNLTLLSLPMIMIYLLLMWIGASPGSTGGGIKTTTAGVAILNMVAVLRGKDRAEFNKAEISHLSVRRAFAVILISVFFMGLSVFFISINDSDKGLIKIAFEVFAAFSTAGLSLGITPDLSLTSKIVLTITMFVGRVGALTMLIAFIRQSRQLYYRYPKEEITL